MNLIVTEASQVRIQCMGSVGIGTISQGTIPLSGPFTGSCTMNPTYSRNVTIDGFKAIVKLNFNLTGCIAGTTPTTNATGSIKGNSQKVKDDNQSLVLSNQTGNIVNGTCTSTSTPSVVTTISATASFINAGQTSSYGE